MRRVLMRGHQLRRGRGGAGQENFFFWSTPPRLRGRRLLRGFFWGRAATPPHLRRGVFFGCLLVMSAVLSQSTAAQVPGEVPQTEQTQETPAPPAQARPATRLPSTSTTLTVGRG